VAVTGLAGESVAASLTALGRLALKQGPDGKPRGLYCGMGACGECLVSIDGERNVRACMTKLVPGMRVRTCAPPELPLARSALAPDRRTPEVLVIGGGPAGLCAALAAHQAGAEVLLVDERESLGGQYFKALAPSQQFLDAVPSDSQFLAGQRLREAVAAAGVPCLNGTLVWGVGEGMEIAALSGDQPLEIRPQRIILAAGAIERAVPLPGWTLPGAMTTGAAQTLIRANRVIPGTRIVVAGNGPLNWQLAAELTAAGAQVVAVAETSRMLDPIRLRHVARMMRLDPRLTWNGARLLARLWSRLSFGSCVTAIHGDEQVESVSLATIDAAGRPIAGSERRLQADVVAMGYGFYAANELARLLGCRHRYDTASGGLIPERAADGQSSVAGVYVVGDGARLGGAPAAQAEGEIAGLSAAAALGHALSAALLRRRAERQRHLQRQREFQSALWSLFAAPRLALQLADMQTIICRCEGVRRAEIAAYLAPGVLIGGMKRQLRAGMGRCQGRYCGPLLAEMIAAPGAGAGESAFFAPRPPVRPLPLGLIARRAQ
jgi:NADPH-dependent 2,4-dienoyl-CoA reductase/sulfur reductase-like enzyme